MNTAQAEDLELLLERAAKTVLQAGAFIRQERQNFDPNKTEYKGKNDLVSYVDRTAESMLVTGLRELLPACGFINEESGVQHPESEWVWIIDPLDGTTNFIHNVPLYCVSVGLMHRDQLVLGIVYEVNRDELFYARKGGGAWLNDKPLRVSETQQLGDSLLATGFPFRRSDDIDRYMVMLKNLMPATRGLRRLGSAALDLAYTAAGRFDGFFEANLSPWDVAAGVVLIQEAGGMVTDFSGGTNYLFGKSIAGSNTRIHRELLENLIPNS